MVIWWAMLVPWVLIPHWVDLARRFEPYTLVPPGVPSLRKTMLAVVVALAAFMWSTPAGWVIDGKPSAVADAVSPGTPWRLARQLKHPDEPDAAWLPELATILQKHYPNQRFTGAILATPMQGDYLMWALAADILGGVTTLTTKVGERTITAVPYFAWANRGRGEMVVWIR